MVMQLKGHRPFNLSYWFSVDLSIVNFKIARSQWRVETAGEFNTD
ncbi:MAG: hypothetical protein ACFCU5_12150 [Pleurocapsa sp.]